jgi:hypothetical protein
MTDGFRVSRPGTESTTGPSGTQVASANLPCGDRCPRFRLEIPARNLCPKKCWIWRKDKAGLRRRPGFPSLKKRRRWVPSNPTGTQAWAFELPLEGVGSPRPGTRDPGGESKAQWHGRLPPLGYLCGLRSDGVKSRRHRTSMFEFWTVSWPPPYRNETTQR